MQKHRDGNQFGIRIERAMSRQTRAVEPRARHMVEQPGLRFSLGLGVGVQNGATVGQVQTQLSAHC